MVTNGIATALPANSIFESNLTRAMAGVSPCESVGVDRGDNSVSRQRSNWRIETALPRGQNGIRCGGNVENIQATALPLARVAPSPVQ